MEIKMHGLYKFNEKGDLTMAGYVPSESETSNFQSGHFYKAGANGFVEAVRPQKPSNAVRRAFHFLRQRVK